MENRGGASEIAPAAGGPLKREVVSLSALPRQGSRAGRKDAGLNLSPLGANTRGSFLPSCAALPSFPRLHYGSTHGRRVYLCIYQAVRGDGEHGSALSCSCTTRALALDPRGAGYMGTTTTSPGGFSRSRSLRSCITVESFVSVRFWSTGRCVPSSDKNAFLRGLFRDCKILSFCRRRGKCSFRI